MYLVLAIIFGNLIFVKKLIIRWCIFQIYYLWLSGTNPGAVSWRIEDLQGVRQGVLEGVSEDVPDVQVY